MATNEYKRCLYRLLTDLAKYDSVITAQELDTIDDTIKSYGITDTDRSESYSTSLAEAVDYVARQGVHTQKKALKLLERCALTDGECSREEALFLSALEIACEGNGGVVSIPLNNRPIVSSQLLYLDSTYNPKKNELDKDYDRISAIAELAGFELIYIPHLAQHFKNSKNTAYLKKLLCIINPTLDENCIANKVKSLQDMDSRYFYIQVLNGKLQMNLKTDRPAWLIRLQDNNVGGIGYANFLYYYIDQNDISGQLKTYVDGINRRLRSYAVVVNRHRESADEFAYDGFHKALLDVMATERVDEWEIKVYVRAGENCIVERNDSKKFAVEICKGEKSYPIYITGREAALYMLLLCASASPGKAADFEYERARSQKLQAQYREAYQIFSNRDAHTPDITLPQTFRPIKSKIMSQLKDSGIEGDLHLFKPTKKDVNSFYIPLPSENVKVVSSEGVTPLRDSAVYKRICEADATYFKALQ